MSDLCACWWPFGRRDSNRGSDGGWSPSPLIQARTKPINIVQGSPLVEQACRKASFAALYDLGPEIGSGSTSTVHKSTQKASGKVFATKVVSAAGLQTPGVADQFASEVLALKRCRHPHVVSLEDAVVDENKLYLVTELLTGGELFDYVVKRGTLGEDEAASILSDVGDAIRFMHDQGASRGVRIDSKSPSRPPSAISDGNESRRRRERARKPRKHAKPPLRRCYPPGPKTRKFTFSEGASLCISDGQDHRLRPVEGARDAGRLCFFLGY